MIPDWLRSLFGFARQQSQEASPDVVEPTKKEMQAALIRLDELARLAVFGEIGGTRPQKNDRAKSWWGGNFLGAEGERVPVCELSGRSMHPVLQIRVDELPEVPPAFEGLALINIWMDLQASDFWRAANGHGFCVRTYADLEGLVPIGSGYRESEDLPTFPVLWRETALEQPDWEDVANEVPTNVARASADDWFFESEYVSDRYLELRSMCPIKLGGWPSWIQGSDWPEDAEFFFQVDFTDKGKMFLGDGGSIYVFRTSISWEIRGDCY